MRRLIAPILFAAACAAPEPGVEDARTRPQTPHAETTAPPRLESTPTTPPPTTTTTTTNDTPPAAPAPTTPAPAGDGKIAPPAASDCIAGDQAPLTSENDARTLANGAGLTGRVASLGERKAGLDKSALAQPFDALALGARLAGNLDRTALLSTATARAGGLGPLDANLDSDGDCLSDADEARLGTDPHNPDSDGDGWFDGACNERRRLYVDSVVVHSSNDWSLFGGDDFYLIADDTRYPNTSLDDSWDDFTSGSTHTLDVAVATRTRGIRPMSFAQVTVEGWDDDFEVFNTWTADDLLFSDPIDLAQYKDGDTFTRRYTTSDYDYEVHYRVAVEHFADPNPLADGDADGDGIKESAEAKVGVDFGGITDPERPDVLVEVDWMAGHRLRTEAKRQVVTRLFQHGLHLFVWRDEEVPELGCLGVPDAKNYYSKYFTNKNYDAFRYAIISEKIWNNASGVTWGDLFLVNDSTWWISDRVLPQAGTFIHELGHTLSLSKDTFHLIDSISWLSYDSAMNYTYQALLVDYDTDGAPGDSLSHDDWADVKAGWALQYSFALVPSNDKGVCP